ncbi:hypothetical protein SSS_03384, partial [Sarcoptes scabiei]
CFEIAAMFSLKLLRSKFKLFISTSRMINNYQSNPLIIIFGATGCGKTRLSLELAKHFPVEIISADSIFIKHLILLLIKLVNKKEIPYLIILSILLNHSNHSMFEIIKFWH